MNESKPLARYTLEFKLEALKLVKGGQVAAVTATILDIPKQTLENWVRLANKGELKGAGDKPVSPEQMELARLRAENARLRMERDILGKATAYFA
ncbi:MAG: transposase, partial [Polaromonas sp.]|nr:transposase [Polaromonas sp.]